MLSVAWASACTTDVDVTNGDDAPGDDATGGDAKRVGEAWSGEEDFASQAGPANKGPTSRMARRSESVAASLAAPPNKGPIGWDTYRQLDLLPYVPQGVQSREFSAFDRDNGNEDGFGGVYSCLRTTAAGCVLAEDRGAGEITSIWFTQINPSNDGIPDEGDVRPTGRITVEVDGVAVVAANLQDIVNGKLGAPFVYPLVANADQSSGGVYIKVPMPYRTSMRVTVQNNPRFYHVNYRHFPDAVGVNTFTTTDKATDVIARLQAAGTQDPKPVKTGTTTTGGTVTLPAGGQANVAQLTGPGAISELRLRFPGVASDDVLAKVRLQIAFDGTTTVDAPVGQFFGSGLGVSAVRSLMFAMSNAANGFYTAWWPMPYRQNATVKLVNGTGSAVSGVEVQVASAPDNKWLTDLDPAGGVAGYFTAISRGAVTTRGQDWLFADMTGRGKFVGISQTMQGLIADGNTRAYLEGDERVYVNDSLSPQWHGTGTEDFYESGWYFSRGTFSAPFLGNTGHKFKAQGCQFECDAAYRLLIADAVPYSSALRFGIEHGPQNDALANYGSTAFLYTQAGAGHNRTDQIDVADAASRTAHAYSESGSASEAGLTARYEGDNGEMLIPGRVRSTSALVSFQLAIDPANQGVLLRRTADQAAALQSAAVTVDGQNVGTWYQPLGNAIARWHADDFPLPAAVTSGKSQITVTIRPDAGTPAWTASQYVADSVRLGRDDGAVPTAPTGLGVVGGRKHALWITWDDARDDTSVNAYRVYASANATVPIDNTTLVGTTRTRSFVHGPLPPKATRFYRVVAVDSAGKASPPSAVFSATTKGATVSSVDGDGRDDIVTFTRGAAADVYIGVSNGSSFGAGVKAHDFFALDGEVPAVGDFNGDGLADIATFTRGSANDVYVALSNGTGFGPAVKWHDFFALDGEVPAVGDFNGDGLADIVTFTRGSTADVYVALSNGTSFGPAAKWNDSFAINTETPAVGDIDGDGRDDIITFTQGTNADVFVAFSDGSRFMGGDFGVTQKWHDYFAPAGEVPGVGDFNGDGLADIVTFTRGSTNDVFVALSNGNGFGAGLKWHDFFVLDSEVPGVGDFNGDGLADIVTFTRGTAADVYVATSNGSSFGGGAKWHDSFALGAEWPQPSLLRP